MENSINNSSYLGKSHIYKDKQSSTVIERSIGDALRDKSLMKKAESARRSHALNPSKSLSSPSFEQKRPQISAAVDTSASAILPKLKSSLHVHSARGLSTVESKIEILIRDFNELAYRK